MRRLGLGFSYLAIVVVLLGLSAPRGMAAEKTVTLGFTASQTGNLNVEAIRQINGLNLWIEQVNKAVMDMDSTTQENASLVQQATSASTAIVEQANALTRRIAGFRLGDKRAVRAPTGSGAPVPARNAAAAAMSAPPVAPAAPAVERRSTSRPWSPPPGVARSGARTAPPPAPHAAGPAGKSAGAAASADSEWQEF